MSDELHRLITDARERLRFLEEIGVDSVSVELPDIKAAGDERQPHTVSRPAAPLVTVPVIEPSRTAEPKRTPGSRLSELPSLSKRPVGARVRNTEPSTQVPSTPAPAVVDLRTQVETIEKIRADIGNCVRCPLHEGRTQIVHSTGNFQARLMFVGEAPGADEDAAGLPFVGRAGKLLTDIITSMGFSRENVFIGNINRCRPPGNRQPIPLETEACRPFLLREVAVVRPQVIVVLGNTATQNLLDIKTPISKIRGQFQDYFGVKVMPTFHPAYLLRDPHKKRDVWEDMKKVRDYINAVAAKP